MPKRILYDLDRKFRDAFRTWFNDALTSQYDSQEEALEDCIEMINEWAQELEEDRRKP